MAPGAELELHGSAGFWGPVCSVHWGSRSMSHKILLLLAIIGPILLIAAGGVAHVWGRRRKRPRAAGQEPENSNRGDLGRAGRSHTATFGSPTGAKPSPERFASVACRTTEWCQAHSTRSNPALCGRCHDFGYSV